MLLQEKYWDGIPWRVLVVCILLNRTRRTQVEPILAEFFEKYPDASTFVREFDALYVDQRLKGLGLVLRRVWYLLGMSHSYLSEICTKSRRDLIIESFPGCGKYAREAWDMIVLGKRDFEPTDVELRKRMNELKGGISGG